MNWLDLLLILILAASIASSFARGFTREVIGLAAAVVGLLCGLWFYRMAGSALRTYVGSPEAANLIGFLLIFALALVIGWILSVLAGMAMKVVGLSWLDRLMGAAFGVARGVIICVALITAIVAWAPGRDAKSPPQAVVQSRLAPYLIDAAHAASMAAPKELRDEFARRYEQVKRIWESALKRGVRRGRDEEI
jgi:membrane protein required for colicin V production